MNLARTQSRLKSAPNALIIAMAGYRAITRTTKIELVIGTTTKTAGPHRGLKIMTPDNFASDQ